MENEVDKNIEHAEPKGWKITLAGFVDAIIAVIPILVIIFFRQPTYIYKWIANINTSLLALIILIVSRFVFILLFDRSIGMILFHLVFLNHEEMPLNLKEKFCAGLFVLIKGVDYYEYQ